MKTETQTRFEDELTRLHIRLDSSTINYGDARALLYIANNLLIRYEEIRKSRDKWKKRYEDLKCQDNDRA